MTDSSANPCGLSQAARFLYNPAMDQQGIPAASSTSSFRKQFLGLIALAWTAPPVFGLGFLLFIEIFTSEQLTVILTTPLMPAYALGTLALALLYFRRYIRPLDAWLEVPDSGNDERARDRLAQFPLHFWGVFLGYLLLSPAVTILSAEWYTDFQARPINWFRIHLVALIVSIIVGLPVFFMLFDLFGRCFGRLQLSHPLLTIKTRVFLIAALVPLLIDTMLVQYYWTRTGYFGMDTFIMWVALELLAVAGALLFQHSFGQSLQPVQGLLSEQGTGTAPGVSLRLPASTDELGIISSRLGDLLQELQLQHERLDAGNEVLRKGQTLQELDARQLIVDTVSERFGGLPVVLLLPDPGKPVLLATHTANTGQLPEGCRRIPLDPPNLFTGVFRQSMTASVTDTRNDDRLPPETAVATDFSSLLLVPLRGEEGAEGVLVLAARPSDPQLGPHQLERLEVISREIASATRLVQERRARQRIEKAISRITEAVSTHSGKEFFHALTEQLVDILHPDGVGIAIRPDDENDVVESLIFWLDGKIVDNMQYSLAGTPCERVVSQQVPVFCTDVQNGFPRDEFLRQIGAETYLGIPLFDAAGRFLGLQFALFRRPMVDATFEMAVMRIFAARIGLEIERLRTVAHIHRLAYFDSLTDLPNRQLLLDRMHQATGHAERSGTGLAVMMLDLDHFKSINDSLGHSIGDHLLKDVALRLQHCVRHEDTVARIGGDEFIVLLQDLAPDTIVQKVTRVAAKIQQQLEMPYRLEGHELMVTASQGIALFPDNGQSTEQLLKHADTALYKAKGQGRNSYRFFSSAMNTEAVERLEMENLLRQALEEGQFELAFQPKVAIHSGEIVGAEALLRWNSPRLGPVSPDRFIPVAEETGLIIPIGERVIELACEAARGFWSENTGTGALQHISVNVSPRQFQQPDLVQRLASILAACGIRPDCIELEITENVLLEGLEQVKEKLHQLKHTGFTIAIDDFGTGYSSLGYLKQLPLDRIKIDRSFVDGLPHDIDDVAIAQAILAMTRHLNIPVVAEGVETGDQLEFLRVHGCDDYQGFHFSKPVSADAFLQLLAAAPVPDAVTRRPGPCPHPG